MDTILRECSKVKKKKKVLFAEIKERKGENVGSLSLENHDI
jgi:hypothetical protein